MRLNFQQDLELKIALKKNSQAQFQQLVKLSVQHYTSV
ncbi:hypothetical protein AQPE_2746 [Aquipluma nitroreducens]|uniref:Uncharacterized protein n=1 Tax=Aquipluma nitroreducens TaxID=2010828 RepID=A0A5K7SAH6_9BACT|nr:hypothetical protein AQPE_2746 [Aquipluma nitroreducens]